MQPASADWLDGEMLAGYSTGFDISNIGEDAAAVRLPPDAR